MYVPRLIVWNASEARAIMEADPAIRAGVMRYRLHSYNIAVARDGLA